ncbi:MAG: 50S ribosomal protein L30 [SAR202 cluster bacterium]|nr:50S ribosomal protein L30 [SAR202 cluster bacterium]|tara:strand:- start:269 stop:481 length:213 start_codon:yes stop_codon:yes gene_type:complete
MSKVRITLRKSPIGYSDDQKKTVKALGLSRLGSSVEHDFSRSIRGMIIKIEHLIEYEEREDSVSGDQEDA